MNICQISYIFSNNLPIFLLFGVTNNNQGKPTYWLTFRILLPLKILHHSIITLPRNIEFLIHFYQIRIRTSAQFHSPPHICLHYLLTFSVYPLYMARDSYNSLSVVEFSSPSLTKVTLFKSFGRGLLIPVSNFNAALFIISFNAFCSELLIS